MNDLRQQEKIHYAFAEISEKNNAMKSRAKNFFEKRKTVLAIFNATITLRSKQHIDALSLSVSVMLQNGQTKERNTQWPQQRKQLLRKKRLLRKRPLKRLLRRRRLPRRLLRRRLLRRKRRLLRKNKLACLLKKKSTPAVKTAGVLFNVKNLWPESSLRLHMRNVSRK